MIGLFNLYAGDSFLHRRNPSVKLLAVFLVVLAIVLSFDPWTPLAFWIAGLAALRLLGRIPLQRVLRPLAGFLLLGLLGFMGSNALFYAPHPGETLTILWQAGPLHISAEGLRAGLALTLRMLAIVTYSILFVSTTDPTDLVLSLIQQAGFPFRLGYGILVAYRFLPLWRSELEIIRAAHRIRGAGERMTLAGRWEQARRYAVPLLAGAIRKAERVAIAMDSRAFGAGPRTYFRRQRVGAADWLLVLGALGLTAGILALLAMWGVSAGLGLVPEA